ncbi:MAG: 30S ribosome-binding factor RbfA [Alphaproteobacteria bacterium]|jgi:ribosome-binding factor A|nr:30S ribosome-binding factor RbfA [Alphaproteobacteria bacterium]MDP6516450.1 30S ribosome-binding factor RbfA [Alphaproteobacteria bacterium]
MAWERTARADRGEPSQRRLRVGESLRHALSEVLARDMLRDPDLAGQSITVTEIRVSPDLRQATAFVCPLGGADMEAVLAALGRAAPFLSVQLGRRVRLKNTPRLTFVADRSYDEASRVDRILRTQNVARDLVDGAGSAKPTGDDHGRS